MKKSLLSIIVPVYNCDKYIVECLSSIVEEIDDEVEVIIVNDGSTDNSVEICNHYVSKNVLLYNNNNHGVSYSRNFGILKAKGKYAMFIDSDDVMIKGWYNKIKPLLNTDFDVCYISSSLGSNYSYKDIMMYIAGINSPCNMSSACSKLYNTSLIKSKNICFNEKVIFGEDLLFNYSYYVSAETIKYLNCSIYKYRINYNSSTHKFNRSYYNSVETFINCVNNILNSSKLLEIDKQSIINYLWYNSLYVAFVRISYINNYKQAINEYKFLKNDAYSIKYNKAPMFYNWFQKKCYFFFKKNMYKSLYHIIDIKNKIMIVIKKIKKKRFNSI